MDGFVGLVPANKCGYYRIYPPGAETGIFLESLGNTMAADDLAPRIARLPAAVVLIMKNKCIIALPDERFELYVPSQCQEMAKYANTIPKINSA